MAKILQCGSAQSTNNKYGIMVLRLHGTTIPSAVGTVRRYFGSSLSEIGDVVQQCITNGTFAI